MARILGGGLRNVQPIKAPKHTLFRPCGGAPLLTVQLVNVRPALARLAVRTLSVTVSVTVSMTLSIVLSMALRAPAQAQEQAPAQAQAQAVEPILTPEVLARATALLHQAAQAGAPRGARILALPGALDARLKLAPCSQVQPFLPAGVAVSGKSRVGLRCVQGPVAWQVFLPVTVQVWAPAVVASAPLPAGARLETSQLALAVVDWAAAPGAPQAELSALDGRVLVRPVAAGQALRPSDLRVRQWFASGDTVQFVAQGRGFSVSAEGQAMAAGLEGQPVRVRMESGRVVMGLPVGQRRVELNL